MLLVSSKAYAKINLGLRVVSKREDGYHDLVTLFQRISLADEILVERTRSSVQYRGPVVTDRIEDNLCVKAAEAFKFLYGSEYGCRITLVKNIPSGAGLGGGSSDAAAVLSALSKLYNVNIKDESLFKIANDLGADVPFFLSGYSSALAEGKGEILKSHTGLNPGYFVLILWPGFSVSSGEAYGFLDDILTFAENNINIIFRGFCNYDGGRLSGLMENDFEKTIFKRYPVLATKYDQLLKAGALSAGLCGSGSALFGIFDGKAEALHASSDCEQPWLSFVCRPC